jgi:hypothetical protein
VSAWGDIGDTSGLAAAIRHAAADITGAPQDRASGFVHPARCEMTASTSILFAILGFVVSARIRLNAIVLGEPMSISLLDSVAVAVVLALAVALLWLLRAILRDRLRLRIRTEGA